MSLLLSVKLVTGPSVTVKNWVVASLLARVNEIELVEAKLSTPNK